MRGPENHFAQQLMGLIVFAGALFFTAGVLGVFHTITGETARHVELAVLTLANLAAAFVRFVLLRRWVFRRR